MRRREFIAGLGSAAATPLGSQADDHRRGGWQSRSDRSGMLVDELQVNDGLEYAALEPLARELGEEPFDR
jgi:hypothetical protein